MNNIEKKLKTLQAIQPDGAFRDRLHAMVADLPDLRPRAAAPLIAFRLAFVVVVLFVLGSLGTGVLLAAKGSNPGSILYPLKQAVDTHHVPFFSIPVASPTAVPTVVPSQHHSVQLPEDHENEHEGSLASPSAHHGDNEKQQDVKGASVKHGDEEKVHLPTVSSSPLQEVPSSVKLHANEELDN